MATTTYSALRYPLVTNATNVNGDIQNLATDVDQKVTVRVATNTDRNALTKFDGMEVFVTGTRRKFRYDSTNSRWDYISGPKYTWTPSLVASTGGAAVTATPLTTSGTYIISEGWIEFDAIFRFQGGVNGQVGSLVMPLPTGVVAKAAEPHTLNIQATLYTNADGNTWAGTGWVTPSSAQVSLLFPATGAASYMQAFRNATGAGVAGSGVPLVSGNYPLTDGSRLQVWGRFELSAWPTL